MLYPCATTPISQSRLAALPSVCRRRSRRALAYLSLVEHLWIKRQRLMIKYALVRTRAFSDEVRHLWMPHLWGACVPALPSNLRNLGRRRKKLSAV